MANSIVARDVDKHLTIIERARIEWHSLQMEMAALETQGISIAYPHWQGRGKRSLYLYHPTSNRKRKRQYVPKDGQNEALERVRRGQQYQLLENRAERLAARLRRAAAILDLAIMGGNHDL